MVVWGGKMKDYECGEDMKECPFCGSNDIICDDRPDGTEVWCNKCEAEGPYASNLGVAERLWNTRKEEIMLKKCPFCGSEEIEFDYNCMRCKNVLFVGVMMLVCMGIHMHM